MALVFFPLISTVNSSATAGNASIRREMGGELSNCQCVWCFKQTQRQNIRNSTYNWTGSPAAGLQIRVNTGEKAQPQNCLSFFLFALKTEKLGGKSLNKLRQKYRFQGTIFGLCFFPRITLSIWQSSVYSVSISMGFTSYLFLALAKLQPTHTILENTHGCSSSPKRMTKDSTVVLSCFYLSVFLLHWNLFNNACKLLRKPDSKTVH